MVVSKKATTVPQSEDNKIVNQAETSDTVTIACHLSSGIIFDSLPTRDGGIKSVEPSRYPRSFKGRRSGVPYRQRTGRFNSCNLGSL